MHVNTVNEFESMEVRVPSYLTIIQLPLIEHLLLLISQLTRVLH